MKNQCLGFFLRSTLLIGLMTCSPNIHAMHYAKGAFSLFCNSAHWAIAAMPFLTEGFRQIYIRDENFLNFLEKNASKAPQEVEQFIQNQLKEVGLSMPINIRYSSAPASSTQWNYASYRNHTLIVDAALDKKYPIFKTVPLEVLLKKRMSAITSSKINKIESELDVHRFALRHEAAHLKANDTHKGSLAHIITPFITHSFALVTKNLLPAFSSRLFVLQNLLKIPTGYAKNFITTQTIRAYQRHQEKLADLSVTNPKLVVAAINEFKQNAMDKNEEETLFLQNMQNDLDSLETHGWIELQLKNIASSELCKQTYLQLLNLQSHHPTAAQRVAYLKKHLEQLTHNDNKRG